MNTKIIGYVLALGLVLPWTGEGQEVDGKVPAEAMVNGNYSGLLRTLKVPEAEKLYGKSCDLGYYPETEYAGYNDLPPGYWVYVAPNWYIWKDSKRPREKEPTIDGTEARDIIGRVTGSVVISRNGWDIVALSLPTLRESLVRRMSAEDADFGPTVHAISGPDRDGRIAYIEDHYFVPHEADQKYLLKTIMLDGSADTAIFSRPGNAMWARHGEIGSHIALAPSGGKVALLSAVKNKQMPGALLHVGKVEIWDVAKKTPIAIEAKALDDAMSWFPDGKRLAHVRLVSRDQLPKLPLGLEDLGKYGAKVWDEVPAVYVLDIESGTSTFLHVGWNPIVSSDGETVLVGGYNDQMEYRWRRVSVASKLSVPVRWPGDAGGAIALLAEDVVLYWGLPTTGARINYTQHNSALRGPKLMLTLKVAVINSTRFQTVVPAIDPRSLVSFEHLLEKR